MALLICMSICCTSRMMPSCIVTQMGSNVVSLSPSSAEFPEQWFNQLSMGVIVSFQEFRSLFLHQFSSSRKHKKTKLNLFVVRQKDGESLKEYLQKIQRRGSRSPLATQEVKASAFSQGLLDGDFFKSLAKKPASKIDALLIGVVNTST
ncbi:UNVERIFIED_CONTAM: hypothetical protein Slati_2539600 [Sesamum latifolium]|uniref:Retrotransposon gag domain-containing protein n=1 Tax=Sesamum latifolium TaxID=2727402 RepID=A0AAW2WIS7_9LAMI